MDFFFTMNELADLSQDREITQKEIEIMKSAIGSPKSDWNIYWKQVYDMLFSYKDKYGETDWWKESVKKVCTPIV